MQSKDIFLTIAGSDPGGGAGIQADIKVAILLGLYPCSVISVLTAQNTLEVSGVWDVEADRIEAQLRSVLEDFLPDGVKIGLIRSVEAVNRIADMLESYQVPNIVVDPVLSLSLSNDAPDEKYIEALVSRLFPLARLVTPNLPEKEYIEKITGKRLELLCNSFLLKGGHSDQAEITDVLYYREEDIALSAASTAFPTINFSHSSLYYPQPLLSSHDNGLEDEFLTQKFSHKKLKSTNTHGTGCILSSSIACYLAKGNSLKDAVRKGIEFTYNALVRAAKFDISKGTYGPALI